MYNDLIILTQLIQHSSGSSPHHHLHTSCFHFIWLICFPASFYISLSLLASLLSCCACPPLYFFPASHPASLCHLFAFKLLSLQPPWWSSISMDFCFSSSTSALPSSQLSGTPKWLCLSSARFFSQLLQSLGVPFLSHQDIVALVPALVSPLRGLCEPPLHCGPLWDPWFTAPLPWRLQKGAVEDEMVRYHPWTQQTWIWENSWRYRASKESEWTTTPPYVAHP